MSVKIITIDGPSGSGKGTLATMLAKHYGYHLLDSGALYRLLGLALQQKEMLNSVMDDLAAAVNIAKHLDIRFETQNETVTIFLNDQDVTNTIRTEQVGEYASKVAAIPELRDALFQRQRAFIQLPGLVADGRDMATAIFPEAQAKIYLTASAQSRAERRVNQLRNLGHDVKIGDILSNIEARDKRDMERAVAPLRPAEDAFEIDSSDLSIDEVFKRMVDYVNRCD